MVGDTYKIIELRGSSDKSWEDATRHAIEIATKSLEDLRFAEVTKLDVAIEGGKIVEYRTKITVSFKVVD